jgi:hypothetical protein
MVPRRVFFAFLVVALAVGCNGTCFRSQFECDSGQCVDNDYRCDGEEDCFDGSDEDGCSAAAGLAIGLSVFFFILFCVVIPIAICFLIYCCVAGPLQHALGGSTVVRTTVNTQAQVPAAGVVTTRAVVCFSAYISHLISVVFPFSSITQ